MDEMSYTELRERIVAKVGKKHAVRIMKQLDEFEQRGYSAERVSRIVNAAKITDQVILENSVQWRQAALADAIGRHLEGALIPVMK